MQYQAFPRHGGQANLVSYAKMQAWVDKLVKCRTDEPPQDIPHVRSCWLIRSFSLNWLIGHGQAGQQRTGTGRPIDRIIETVCDALEWSYMLIQIKQGHGWEGFKSVVFCSWTAIFNKMNQNRTIQNNLKQKTQKKTEKSKNKKQTNTENKKTKKSKKEENRARGPNTPVCIWSKHETKWYKKSKMNKKERQRAKKTN